MFSLHNVYTIRHPLYCVLEMFKLLYRVLVFILEFFLPLMIILIYTFSDVSLVCIFLSELLNFTFSLTVCTCTDNSLYLVSYHWDSSLFTTERILHLLLPYFWEFNYNGFTQTIIFLSAYGLGHNSATREFAVMYTDTIHSSYGTLTTTG